jgi:hypothetical protein
MRSRPEDGGYMNNSRVCRNLDVFMNFAPGIQGCPARWAPLGFLFLLPEAERRKTNEQRTRAGKPGWIGEGKRKKRVKANVQASLEKRKTSRHG